MKNRKIIFIVLIALFTFFSIFLTSYQLMVLDLYRMAPENLVGIKHKIIQKGDKYLGTISGGEEGGVTYNVNLETNRMISTQEYFRDAHLGVTTSVAKQSDNNGNEYLVIYFENVTGGTGVKSSEIKVLQLSQNKWKIFTRQVIPDIDIIQFMEDGFDKNLFKKLKGASGILIKEYKLPIETSHYISVSLITTWLPSQVTPPLHEVISNISDKIKYSFILKWDYDKGKFISFKKVLKDEVETFFASLNN